ncbi:hypothetical protein GCM10008957_30950 [Deinococcus ruber]|uniref:Uncharacterized protein n=2 Tax=Deinococcus ruber TaxID=1848197 RepID=A0A918F8N3_9DEIO|nr:hypothetical protein GCM10008957_30950 [Deinococcus ruber]
MGFGLLCAPLLIQTYGPREGIQQVVFLSLILNVVFLAQAFRQARVKDALGLLVPSWLVTPLLVLLFQKLSPQVLILTAGSLTLASAAVLALGLTVTMLKGLPGAVLAGVVSAAMNVAGGLAGPAVAMYAVNAAWPAESVRPTLQLYGIGLNLMTLLSLGVPALRWPLLVGLAGGLVIGSVGARRMPATRIRPVILSLAVAGGVLVIVRGWPW